MPTETTDPRHKAQAVNLRPIITAEAVHETLMSMHARRDQQSMRDLFKGSVCDEDILRLVRGVLVLKGDSHDGIEIVAAEAGPS